jgi:hypothetical protein
MISAIEELDLDGPVAYEACTGFHADDEPGRCAGCGWAEDDHEPVVVEIGWVATPLRRAS